MRKSRQCHLFHFQFLWIHFYPFFYLFFCYFLLAWRDSSVTRLELQLTMPPLNPGVHKYRARRMWKSNRIWRSNKNLLKKLELRRISYFYFNTRWLSASCSCCCITRRIEMKDKARENKNTKRVETKTRPWLCGAFLSR